MANEGRLRRHAAFVTVVVSGALLAPPLPASAAVSSFVVNSSQDDNDGSCDALPDGDCTLREAVIGAEADIDASLITFAIPGTGPHTIVTGGYGLSRPTIVDATTQPGASCPAAPMVQVTSTGTRSGNGFVLGNTAATSLDTGITVRGFSITNFDAGLHLSGPYNTVECNVIGLNPDGVTVNSNSEGIFVAQVSSNVIGGTTVEDRNIIAGNLNNGIWFFHSPSNAVVGNYIGTDKTGQLDRGNGATGISFQNSAGVVGGSTATAGAPPGNVISGNNGSGITTFAGGATVQGNLIGLAADGATALGNTVDGIGMINNGGGTIGGPNPGDGNVIAHNGGYGFQGRSCCFPPVHTVTLLGNRMYGNANGINLDAAVNDPGDPDQTGGGLNEQQNYPVITDITRSAGNVIVDGTLDSNASEEFAIEVFSNPTCHASGRGQGKTLLGRTTAVTNAIGNATFTDTFPAPSSSEQVFTAIATDNAGRSSEFSQCSSGATLIVNHVGDDVDAGGCERAPDGDCTLREALTTANGNATVKRVQFDIPGSGIKTITVGSRLTMSSGLALDATTQPGATCPSGQQIRLAAASGGDGLYVAGTAAASVRGFVINGFISGIHVDGSNKTLTCNIIGLTPDGVTPAPNTTGITVHNPFSGSSDANVIGGSGPLHRNIISGNTEAGINLHTGTANVVSGNFIGTDVTGTLDRGNGAQGINAFRQFNGELGGPTATPGTGAGNVISGNGMAGVSMVIGNTVVRGNAIGTDLTGEDPLGNTGAGVSTFNIVGAPTKAMIGGPSPADSNILAFNGGAGYLGTSCCFPPSTETSIQGNSIFSNGGEGIDLGTGDNDSQDADGGANGGQNWPAIVTAQTTGSTTAISGTLHSSPDDPFTLEFFSSDTCEREGRRFLGSASVATDPSGDGSFNAVVPGSPIGDHITATATASAGGTSEFSTCTTLERIATPTELAILGITPASGSNAGTASLTVTGAAFSPGTTVALEGDGGVHPATSSAFIDSSRVFATFDLVGLTPGQYDVVVSDADAGAGLPDAYTVTTGPPGQLMLQIDGTPFVRPNTFGNAWVTYRNAGETDIPAPLLKVDISLGTMMTPHGEAPSVQFLGINSTGDAGVLPPGATGIKRLQFRASNLSGPALFLANVELRVLSITTPDSGFDWAAAKPDLRPAGMSDAGWDVVFENLRDATGETLGDYQRMLGEHATALSRSGQYVDDTDRLLGFAAQDAANAFPSVPLETSVDIDIPAAGTPLVLARIYDQDIDARHDDGPLGLGWRHNWDYTLRPGGDDALRLDTPDGAALFQLAGAGVYRNRPHLRQYAEDTGAGYDVHMPHGLVLGFGSEGQLLRRSDANGNAVDLTYDGQDRLTELHHTNGDTLMLTYNDDDLIATATDHVGRITTYTYNAEGTRLAGVDGPTGITAYEYSTAAGRAQGSLAQVTDPDGSEHHWTYDSRGRVTAVERAAQSERVEWSYGDPGEVVMERGDDAPIWLRFEDRGRLAEYGDAAGTSRHTFDPRGRRVLDTRPDGTATAFQYSFLGDITKITDTGGQAFTFGYGASAQLPTSYTDPLSDQTQYSYDAGRNLESATYSDDSVETFTYDGNGRAVTRENRRGQVVTSTYTDRGLLERREDVNGVLQEFTYDDRGNMLTAVGPAGATTMTYDEADRLESVEDAAGRTLAYTYDAAGRPTGMTDQDGDGVVYGYDAAGRLSSVEDQDEHAIAEFTYDTVGRIARQDAGNGTYLTNDYDSAGRLKKIVHHAPDGTVRSSFTYGYDALGRRISIAGSQGLATYDYDANDRLTAAHLPGGRHLEYEYNARGDRTSVVDNGAVTAFTPNVLQQYTSVGSSTREFDADGNLVQSTTAGVVTTYTYDVDNRLLSVSKPGDTWSYEYDALGNRSASVHNGDRTEYLVDPSGMGDVVAEYDDGGDLAARYLGTPSAVWARVGPTGERSYYAYDDVGSTVDLTAENASVLNSYTYLPFGEPLTTTETAENPFRFNGAFGIMTDPTGLVWMRNRTYEPATGAFTSVDELRYPPKGLYTFAANDPVRYLDVEGRSPAPPPHAHGPQPDYNRIDFESNCDYWDQLTRFNRLSPTIVDGHAWIWGDACDREIIEDYWGGRPPPQNDGMSPNARMTTRIVRAYDPNDIIGPEGAPSQQFVLPGDRLDYAIRFENLPEAAAAAQQVVVTTDLDGPTDDIPVDLSSVRLGIAGFADEMMQSDDDAAFSRRVDDRARTGLFVDVTGTLDESTGVATWTFESIDPTTLLPTTDALAGFLPPNTDTPEGEGFVTFSVKPLAEVPSGAPLLAQAEILFDDNDPIVIPVWSNVVDRDPPTSAVTALPAVTETPSFLVSWTSDALTGSDVEDVDVYVSDDGGPYAPWTTPDDASSAMFDGVAGHHYEFFSRATDAVGNVEPAAIDPDASTTVRVPFSVSLESNAPKVWGAPVAFTATPSRAGAFTYRWDFDADGTSDRTTSAATIRQRFDAPGNRDVRVRACEAGICRQDSTSIRIDRRPAALTYVGSQHITGGSAVLRAKFDQGRTGRINRAYVAFDVYPSVRCGSGTPRTHGPVRVRDTGAKGDGLGSAATKQAVRAGKVYCVVARLSSASSAAIANRYYRAAATSPVGITRVPTARESASGGGVVRDSAGRRWAFAWNVGTTTDGGPRGAGLAVFRGPVNGVRADSAFLSTKVQSVRFNTQGDRVVVRGIITMRMTRISNGRTMKTVRGLIYTLTWWDRGSGGDRFALRIVAASGRTLRVVGTAASGVGLISGGVVVRVPA